jgi:hypothetical protein
LEGRGRQISEFEASLVYKVSSRTTRATQRNPISEKKKKKVCRSKEKGIWRVNEGEPMEEGGRKEKGEAR